MVVEHADVLEKVNKVLNKDCKNKSFLETIEALVDHIEKVDKEFLSMAEALVESDGLIDSLQQEIRVKDERIKDIVDRVHTVANHNVERRLVKAGYMDLDD
jgi:peptidoglycan hydrolase CwlO-like protein